MGEPVSHPREPPQWRWEEEDPLAEHLRGACQEAFSKYSDLVKCIRQIYFRAHWPVFEREVTHDLTYVFKELVEMASLMDTEVHWVQDQWQGKKKLHAANHAARGSAKDLHYFQVVSPTESSKILGLMRIHSSKALKHQTGLSFCSWCGKRVKMRAPWWITSVLGTTTQFRHNAVPYPGCQSMWVCDGKPNEELDWSLWYHLNRSSPPKNILQFMLATLIATPSYKEDACCMGLGNPQESKSKMIKLTQKWNKSRLKHKLLFVFILMHHMKWLY